MAVFALLASCSTPVMFRVEADEPILGGQLTLNGHSAKLVKKVDGAYWAKWNGADADGKIVVEFSDGARSVCRVGYATTGMGVQSFEVRRRVCRQSP